MSRSNLFCPLLCGSQYKNLKEHLIYCKKHHLLGKYYFQCPFNPEHIIGKKIYELHIQNCRDSKNKKNENQKVFDLTKIKTLYKNPKILIKPKLNQNILYDDNFEFQNKFSKIKESESKKEIELKGKNKKKEEKEGIYLIKNKKITTHHKNVFSLDYLMKKENEKILLSTISDYSETYDESPKRVSKTKKKVIFARMVKVIIYKKNEGNNKLKKNQKISNDSNFIQETYMKFL